MDAKRLHRWLSRSTISRGGPVYARNSLLLLLLLFHDIIMIDAEHRVLELEDISAAARAMRWRQGTPMAKVHLLGATLWFRRSASRSSDVQPHAQKAGASTVHLHACSTTLSPHSTSARLLIAPFMPLLTGADLMAGRHAEEVQQVLVCLRG